MKMKKWVIGILLLVLIILPSFGQGQKEQSSESNNAKKEITLLSWRYKPDDEIWKQIATAYAKANPNVSIKLINVSDNNSMEQKVAAMVAGNQPLDIVWTDSSVTQTLGKSNLLEPLESYIKRDNFDLSQLFMSSKYDSMWDGELVGIPAIPMGYMIFYNKDLFDEAGLSYPTNDWTMEDFLKTAQALTKPQIKQFGYGTRPWIGTHDLSFIYAFGGRWFDDSGKPVMNEPGTVKAYQFIQDLIFKYNVAPGLSGGSSSTAQAITFDSGKLGMNWSGTWDIKGTEGPNSKWGFRWGVVLPPKGPNGQYPIVISNGWSILKTSNNKEEAWDFLKWWNTSEVQSILAKSGEIPINIEYAEKESLLFMDETDRNTVFESLKKGISRPTNWAYYAQTERESNAYRDKIYMGDDVQKTLNEMKENADKVYLESQK